MSDYITEDHLFQIFKWLPVKSLLRVRSLSKGFKQLIDSDFFIHHHLAVQSPKLLVAYEKQEDLLVLDPRALPSVESLSILPFDDELETYCIVGTLHGIVCFYDKNGFFYIWNPSIRIYAVVPLPDFIEFTWDDQIEVSAYLGFWMDNCTKHFKIIVFKLVSNYTLEPLVNGVLYSSITQEWVSVPVDRLKDYGPQIEGPPVLIGEVAHWRAQREWIDQRGIECRKMVILSFDFGRGSFDIMEMPHEKNSGFFVKPCKLEGSLSLVYSYPPKVPYRSAVYVRREGVWVKRYDFELLSHLSGVFWVWEGSEGRCTALASSHSEALVLYDAKGDCIELRSGIKNYFFGIFVASDYVESFLFPWF